MAEEANCFTSLYALLMLLCCATCSYGLGTFGFSIHHRFSDPVERIMAVDDLPEKGSFSYYSALAHRDRLFHVRVRGRGRGLVTETDQTPLTFEYGNDTYRLDFLGFLYYANVSLGTPALSYLVALDTGSDLFWLPCDCGSFCINGLNLSSGQVIEFNIYSPSASSTSSKVTCKSSLCENHRLCISAADSCPYQVRYISEGTSSTGTLVEDVLHLITNDNKPQPVNPRVTFGCGRIQTGSFLRGAAPNGLFGLGITKQSVPSILASQGLIPNSFSMCFATDGLGRISFGDQGSSGQGETPFSLGQSHPTYNVTITKIIVGGLTADVEFNAIFDSGTSFTYLNDPAYTQISESFNNLTQEKRFPTESFELPFDYCYVLSSNQSNISYPDVNLTMKGGDTFFVNKPIVIVSVKDINLYCLAVVKSDDVSIIGQNFMTGYKVVFNRDKNVLGWTPSNCYDESSTGILPVSPATSPAVPPAIAVNPEARTGNDGNSPISSAPTAGSHSPKLRPFTFALVMLPISVLAAF
ncbi:aspartyl protease family protein 1-like [Mangifera indica]|uniref:aspartyl protease family protein 1-like n=1 Tax=Mangifera indica TaxID=29780 RepID=UPI001CFB2EA1|nr:aspartyl protease family protein 1-like [Mangifera indica]